MSTTLEAIYENGKLLLSRPLPLPERAQVRITIETAESATETERAAWLKLSEQSLLKTWDNPGDDVFNDLLKK